jgi:hypothetical protein
MASEADRLEEQLRRAFEGEAWHGPSVLEARGGLGGASVRPSRPRGARHLGAGAPSRQHVSPRPAPSARRCTPLTPAEDWPPVPPPTADGWREAIRALRELNEDLRRAVKAFPAERLDEPLITENPNTAYTQLIGITQHDLYHAGQISMLKKALVS